MADPHYSIDDLGDRRVLTMEGRTYQPTRYSKRVIEMLIARKGNRAPLYFPFKELRGQAAPVAWRSSKSAAPSAT
jgi:hypothetical protein